MANKPFLRAALTACALCAAGISANAALAQADYPTRPIRVIVPLAPGGGSDVTARFMGARLTDRLGGQTMVVDNRPAASGIVGTDLVAKANPDGYTLLLVFSTHAQSAQLFKKLPYDPINDFQPITNVIQTPLILLTHPSFPVNSVKELIAYGKANPGKLNYGSSGPGSSPHLASELFASMAGIKMTHIPYKGVAPQITAHLGGEIQVSFANSFTTQQHWKAGRLKFLAVGGPKRIEAYPEFPTISESGVPGYEALIWYGYMGPAKLPKPILAKLHREITGVATSPEVKAHFTAQGNEVVADTPEHFAATIKMEADKWGALGRKLGVSMD